MAVANPVSQIFELDLVESVFVTILNASTILAYPLNAQGKREVDTNLTPRVEIQLTPKPIEGRRHLIDTRINNSIFQPYNTWTFDLSASIITNRETNGVKHLPMMGAVRWELTRYRLLTTFTETVSPYHSLIDIRDGGELVSYDSDKNLDTSKILLSGMFAAREDSWPTV